MQERNFTPCNSSLRAAKVALTGRKREKKIYQYHTGHIGGIKERTARSILEGKFPERIVEKAVQRMLPHGPLGRKQHSLLSRAALASQPAFLTGQRQPIRRRPEHWCVGWGHG